MNMPSINCASPEELSFAIKHVHTSEQDRLTVSVILLQTQRRVKGTV